MGISSVFSKVTETRSEKPDGRALFGKLGDKRRRWKPFSAQTAGQLSMVKAFDRRLICRAFGEICALETELTNSSLLERKVSESNDGQPEL